MKCQTLPNGPSYEKGYLVVAVIRLQPAILGRHNTILHRSSKHPIFSWQNGFPDSQNMCAVGTKNDNSGVNNQWIVAIYGVFVATLAAILDLQLI